MDEANLDQNFGLWTTVELMPPLSSSSSSLPPALAHLFDFDQIRLRLIRIWPHKNEIVMANSTLANFDLRRNESSGSVAARKIGNVVRGKGLGFRVQGLWVRGSGKVESRARMARRATLPKWRPTHPRLLGSAGEEGGGS